MLVTTAPGWSNDGGLGSAPPTIPTTSPTSCAPRLPRYPTVRRWMVWGEPNRATASYPTGPTSPVGPRRYAELLDAAYGALKEASPGTS